MQGGFQNHAMRKDFPIFPPSPASHPTHLIEQKLGLSQVAVSLPYEAVEGAKAQFCFQNVRDVVRGQGGEIVYGWLVWQHGGIFVEAEHHTVWKKPTGEVVCITPHNPPEKAVTFIPDPSATYDWNADHLTHNVRVALLNDPRLLEFFKVCEEQTEIMNAAPRIGIGFMAAIEKSEAMRHSALEIRKATLMTQIVMALGRNDPCYCGSGKKYKKCHGGTNEY